MSGLSKNWALLGSALLGAGLSALAYRTYKRAAAKAPTTAASSAAAAGDAKAQKTPARRVVSIGTRESKLAMWQALHVQARLQALHPDVDFEVVGMTTLGDQNLTDPLSNFSSKGVFTKELDVALLNGRIDLAVHCMKDLPTTLPDGIAFCGVLERGDVEDALVLHPKHRAAGITTLGGLPDGAVVGTSALRRVAVLAKHYPKLQTKNVRGNVNTRLAKLDAGEYDALILASVGLKRLGFDARVASVLNSGTFGYAVGQGALAIVCRAGDAAHGALCAPLTHTPTLFACAAERGLLKELQGGCKVPIAVRSIVDAADTAADTKQQPSDGAFGLTVHGAVISLDGKRCVEGVVRRTGLGGQQSATETAAHALGVELGQQLKAAGADAILAEIKG